MTTETEEPPTTIKEIRSFVLVNKDEIITWATILSLLISLLSLVIGLVHLFVYFKK